MKKIRITGSWGWIFGTFGIALSVAISTAPRAQADLAAPYQMKGPALEARATWVEGAQDPEVRDHVTRLLRSYRTYSTPAPLALKDAPFVNIIVLQQVETLYPLAYDQAKVEKYKEIVENVSVEALFDGLLQGIVDQTLSPELAEKTKAINPCLAQRSLKGKSDSCALDLSEQTHDPGFWAQLWGAVDCALPFHFISDCDTRRLIFDSAKPDLLAARANPDVRKTIEAEFEARFPKEFRRGFMEELAKKAQGFPELVASKFEGVRKTFWDEATPLVETDAATPTRLTIRGFAEGLKADILAAQTLARSSDPEERGMGAALFFASANRLLLMTGGKEAAWDGQNFALTEGDDFDPSQPKKAPLLRARDFGGWAVNGSGFAPWDWAGYDPMPGVSALRLFPSYFALDSRGVPRLIEEERASQRLEDLAILLDSFITFLKATQAGGVFDRHFGTAEQLAEILDPKSPVLFPREGRLLAIGAMAGILKNLVVPGVGHIEIKDPGAPDFGLGISFHESLGVEGRQGGAVAVPAVARTLLSASDLRRFIQADREVPQDLVALTPQLDTALQIGALVLGAQGQEADGRFKSHLEGRPDSASQFEDTMIGLRALTRAYEESEMLVLLLRVKEAWLALDRIWSAGGAVRPSVLWETLSLWNETQKAVRPALDAEMAPELDWGRWDRRMAETRARLLEQLRGAQGPEILTLSP